MPFDDHINNGVGGIGSAGGFRNLNSFWEYQQPKMVRPQGYTRCTNMAIFEFWRTNWHKRQIQNSFNLEITIPTGAEVGIFQNN